MRTNSQLRYSKISQANVPILSKSLTQWRYSFHHRSIFPAWFGLSLGDAYSVSWARKHYTCAHMFGCLESFFRKAAKTLAILLFFKGALSLLGVDLQQETMRVLKDNVVTCRDWDQQTQDLAFVGF